MGGPCMEQSSSLRLFGRVFLVAILVLVAVWILRPLLPALAWAGVLALATWPAREWLIREGMTTSGAAISHRPDVCEAMVARLISQWPLPGVSGSSVTSGGPPCANAASEAKTSSATPETRTHVARRRCILMIDMVFKIWGASARGGR